jgi:hypothetical protein
MKRSSLVAQPELSHSGNMKAQDFERKLKICIVFDEEASARNAEVLIRHITSDFECDTRLFKFDELRSPQPRVKIARSTYDTDILVLSVRDDQMLPAYVQKWIGICMGLRGNNQQGALVALIANALDKNLPPSELLVYLEAVASISGLAFFPRQRNFINVSGSEVPPTPRWSGDSPLSLPA